MHAITISPVAVPKAVVPEATVGRTAGDFFCDALSRNGHEPQSGDVLVVSSKVVSFFEGGLIRLDEVRPSRKARLLGRVFGKDARKLQLLMQTGKVLIVLPLRAILRIPGIRRMMIERSPNPKAMLAGYASTNRFTLVVRAHAAYLDEAGIDHTNSPEEYVTVLPPDPCAEARKIRRAIAERYGAEVAVIVTDTVTCIGRLGSQDIAIGYAGIDPTTRDTFSDDLFGTPRSGGIDLVIDSMAGIAGLVMGQTTELTPAVLIRGFEFPQERAEDAERGIESLGYPPGATWRIVLYTLAVTASFKLVSLLSFQRWPRKTRAK
jgi:coenzyme F420-0:L-glutamate ligase/coenzyme F420-1:gamma-L-glutamate ligase